MSDCYLSSELKSWQAASAPVELCRSLSSLRSAELKKPCQGQPSVSEVLQVVLKECRKDNLVYKIAALRCAGDVLHASQEDYFSTMAEILFPLIKKVARRSSLLHTSCCCVSISEPSRIPCCPCRVAHRAEVHRPGRWRTTTMTMLPAGRRKSCRRRLCSAPLTHSGSAGPETHRPRVGFSSEPSHILDSWL